MEPSPRSCRRTDFQLASACFNRHLQPVKSFLTLLITLLVLVAFVGGAGSIYYLAKTSEISRVEHGAPPSAPGR